MLSGPLAGSSPSRKSEKPDLAGHSLSAILPALTVAALGKGPRLSGTFLSCAFHPDSQDSQTSDLGVNQLWPPDQSALWKEPDSCSHTGAASEGRVPGAEGSGCDGTLIGRGTCDRQSN